MGDNDYGQLGDGTFTKRDTPVQITAGVMQVAGGYSHSLFIKEYATIKGDLNQDGKVDLKDSILGLKLATGFSTSVNKLADVDGDQKTGLAESIYALQETGCC